MPEKKISELVRAVSAFDAEIARFEALVANARHVRLDSRRNLEKAARVVTEAGQCQLELGTRVAEFMKALDHTRDDNQRAAAELQALADQIQRRQAELVPLMERLDALAREAGSISGEAQRIGVEKANDPRAAVAELGEIEGRMSSLVEGAKVLAEDSRSLDFAELGHEVDSLKQQLQSARNKILLLRQQLGGPGVSDPS